MMNVGALFTSILFLACTNLAWSSRVLEVSDKLIELSQEGQWLVKFYAPWCAHCRRLEPAWAQVAQALYNTPIRVAKADCTRFTELGRHFKVAAYPTIMFIKDGVTHTYHGEHTKDDIVLYATRMSQPPVQHITLADSVRSLQDSDLIFFAYVGEKSGPIWDMYLHHAQRYQAECWFYSISQDVARREINANRDNGVFVYKDTEPTFFEVDAAVLTDRERLNTTLDHWINAERFGTFPKVTRTNIHRLMDTGKYLVLAVVQENKLHQIKQQEKDFRDMIEGIIRKSKSTLHPHFQFGWIGSPELSQSITMSVLATPHLVVLNSTTNHHHIPEDDAAEMTPEAVEVFLKQIYAQAAPAYGGKSFFVRAYRVLFEARTSLAEMWRGNPVLTALVFGLPLGFLSLICYSIFCADILDADEEEDSEDHEKKD